MYDLMTNQIEYQTKTRGHHHPNQNPSRMEIIEILETGKGGKDLRFPILTLRLSLMMARSSQLRGRAIKENHKRATLRATWPITGPTYPQRFRTNDQ